ncbi:MAG: hypothetical protein MK085_08985 [Phycisphaerales bacterium]|nr:hypothetical protein [Phycisphaerales bacterium]
MSAAYALPRLDTLAGMKAPLPARPPTSQLALAAFLCSILVCVPMLGLVAVLLGALSLSRIRNSGGAIGGRRLALWAMGIGSAMLVIWVMGLDRFQGWYLGNVETRMTTALESAVQAAIEGDPAGVRSEWGSTATMLGDEAILEFGKTADSRWGGLLSVSLNRSNTVGTVLDPAMTATFEFEFETTSRPGAATFALVTNAGELLPSTRILQMEISDPDHDPLRLGVGLVAPLAEDAAAEAGEPEA